MASPSSEVIRRRRVLAVALLGVVAVIVGVAIASAVSGGSSDSSQQSKAVASSSTSVAESSQQTTTAATLVDNPQRITALTPGTAKVVTEAQGNPRQVALTFDDGFCPDCVKKIVDTLESSGAHATFFPNGRYAASWDPQADRIKQMVASGQLTLGNHTFSHGVSTQIGAEAFGQDLQRNEDWIQKTFGLTGRPWFRPPYGDYNSGTVAKAGELGYTNVVMWSGTVADSSPRTPKYILNAIKYWAKPGRIILMHGNYPATAQALPKILTMLKGMNLQPVTMAELAKNGTRSNSPSTGY
jgi:peptidoglycan/xylan/chitin deacetylase (PgdA/CDA1 family)